ncbi:hypothetical protein KSS87_012884, partial [Heliosperma pusillum]
GECRVFIISKCIDIYTRSYETNTMNLISQIQ